jgi:methylaspartate mutase epsilon subunit
MSPPASRGCVGDITGERAGLIDRYAGDLDVATAGEYLRTLPRARFASLTYQRPHERPYLQPRGGFPSVARQRALTVAFDEAGADFVPLTIDSHTRHNDYRTASRLLAAGLAENRDLLNGYPLVSHGVEPTRGLFDGVDRPVSLRHGTPDARLLAEIALAAGITEIEGGGLSYTLPYSRGFPLERALLHWQYVDRLCAVTGPADAPVHRESFGPLTATLVPPVITAVVQLCELLLAAEQGVTSFSVSFGQTGSFEQDIALAGVLRRLSAELPARFGLPEVHVALVYHQWMGAFPVEASLAWQLIAVSAAISRLAGADKVVIKTPDEAKGIPSIDSNVAAVRAVRYVLDMFQDAAAHAGDAVEEERDLIGSEVEHVLAHIFAQPGASLLSSVHRAVLTGAVDVPFAPHEQNAGRLVAERGAGRRIRLLDPGSVPISPGDMARERRLAGERAPRRGPLWEHLLRDIRVLV